MAVSRMLTAFLHLSAGFFFFFLFNHKCAVVWSAEKPVTAETAHGYDNYLLGSIRGPFLAGITVDN